MFTYFSFKASNPIPFSLFLIFSTITDPSRPALIAICLTGSSKAFTIIFTPVLSSLEVFSKSSSTFGITFNRTVPPPGTIPSSTAALVAASASSILNFLSLSSVSVAAPTSITATPPASFASLSCNFSLSKSESVS